MVEKHNVKGYEGFFDLMKKLKAGEKVINVLFSGAKDENVSVHQEYRISFKKFESSFRFQGVSWCSDCVSAEPFIDEALDKYGENTLLVSVDVGDRYARHSLPSRGIYSL